MFLYRDLVKALVNQTAVSGPGFTQKKVLDAQFFENLDYSELMECKNAR